MLRFAQICISLKSKYVWFPYFFWFTGMGEVEITILHSCFVFYRRNFPKLTFWFSWLQQCAMTWTIQATTTRESGLLLFLPLKSLGKVTIGKLDFFGRSGFPPHSLTFSHCWSLTWAKAELKAGLGFASWFCKENVYFFRFLFKHFPPLLLRKQGEILYSLWQSYKLL